MMKLKVPRVVGADTLFENYFATIRKFAGEKKVEVIWSKEKKSGKKGGSE